MRLSDPRVATTLIGPGDKLQPDDLDHGRRRQHTLIWIGGLSMLLGVTIPVAGGLGPVAIPPGQVAEIVLHHLFGWPDEVTWSATMVALHLRRPSSASSGSQTPSPTSITSSPKSAQRICSVGPHT